MLNTYIKNHGYIHNNNSNHINSLNWDLDYDGNTANISVNTINNGKHKHYDVALDNKDLAHILNINSINKPIDERLLTDFYENNSLIEEPYLIELPSPELKPRQPLFTELIDKRISSPLPNEEFIVPLTIDKDSKKIHYTLTPKKKHKKHKTHITHRAYKKSKSSKKLHHSRKNKLSSLIDLL